MPATSEHLLEERAAFDNCVYGYHLMMASLKGLCSRPGVNIKSNRQEMGYTVKSMMAGSQLFAVSQVWQQPVEWHLFCPHEHTHALTKHLSDFSCWDPFDLVECCAASMNSLTLPQNVLPSQQPCSHHDYTVWQQRIQWYQHKYAYSWKHRASRSMEAQSANW